MSAGVGPRADSTISALLAGAVRVLEAAGIDTARLDAEALMRHVTRFRRTQLLTRSGATLAEWGCSATKFTDLVARRVKREPVAYITGEKEFWSLDFDVCSDALIPRPETEHLVEAAVHFGRAAGGPIRVADIGTGTGCIAVAIASECLNAHVLAVDLSAAALRVCQRNVVRHRLADRVDCARADLTACLGSQRFHLLVSNPPYVRRATLDGAAPELAFEPRMALASGADGLNAIRTLLATGQRALIPHGRLLCEIGSDQGAAVAETRPAKRGGDRSRSCQTTLAMIEC